MVVATTLKYSKTVFNRSLLSSNIFSVYYIRSMKNRLLYKDFLSSGLWM